MNTYRQPDNGFSLVELMVALVVGAILAHAVLSLQKYSVYLASNQHYTLSNLNYVQELLARKGLEELSTPSGVWISTPEIYGGRWRTVGGQDVDPEGIRWMHLETEVHGLVLEWSWPVIER
ncbi:prepilin-type N-terminal cleavage/methylation domain-containing protein [Desulfonatronospira sp.]|uniref:PilW family protein n=1 Tax=Desulfonatronospira sp. TaxID=1962951 RepID=UPI0025C22625|nr:prepilin-type N-terminal cleavage/methylation domain-containing protein [Desulfonatronospira sp.]